MPSKMRSSHPAASAVSRVELHALAPSLPPVPRLRSDLAQEIAERGYITAIGTVTGMTTQPGSLSASLNCDFPALTRAAQTAGGNSVVLTIDCDCARYLPVFTRLELAIRVLRDDE